MPYELLEPEAGYEILEPDDKPELLGEEARTIPSIADTTGGGQRVAVAGVGETLAEPLDFGRDFLASAKEFPHRLATGAEYAAAAAMNIPAAMYRSAVGTPDVFRIQRNDFGQEEIVSVPKPLPFQPGQPLLEGEKTVLQPEGSTFQQVLEGLTTPGMLAAFPFAAAKPVQMAFLAQTAPAAVESAMRLVSPDTPVDERKEAATEALLNGLMSYGLARHLTRPQRAGEPYAQAIREDTGQLPQAGQVVEGIEAPRGYDVEQAAPIQPEPVAPRVSERPQAEVLPPVEPQKVASEVLTEERLKSEFEKLKESSPQVQTTESRSSPLAEPTPIVGEQTPAAAPEQPSKSRGKITIKVKNPYGLAPDNEKILTVTGSPVTLDNAPGYEFVAYQSSKNYWRVVERDTGLSFNSEGKTKAEAIANAKSSIQKVGFDKFKEAQAGSDKLNKVEPTTSEISNKTAPETVKVEQGETKPAVEPGQGGVPYYRKLGEQDALDTSRKRMRAVPQNFKLAYLDGWYAAKKSSPSVQASEPAYISPEEIAERFEQASERNKQRGSETVREIEAREAAELQSKQQPELVGMGGAVPSEFNRSGSPTAMKYRQIDAERSQRGLEPLAKSQSVSDQQALDRAMAKIDQDPSFPEQLVRELNEKPRPIQDWENHALLLRKIELRAEYEKSAREAAQAYEDAQSFPERRGEMEAANARTQMWSERLSELESASRKSGSERGRALRALRVMVNEDFSLASLEMQKRAERGGAPITAAERAGLQKIADDYRSKAEALELHQAEREQRAAKIAVEEALARVERESAVSPRIIVIAEKIVAGLDRRADAARARIRERGFRFNVGLDPTVIRDVAEIGASYIGHAALDFTKWSVKMIEEFPGINPHLKTIWEASNKLIDELDAPAAVKRVVKGRDATDKIASAKEKIAAKLKEGDKDIARLAQQIARAFVERGVKGREAVIDSVHGVLREIDPEITRRETMDAISGYGEFKQLSQDQISVELRGIKGEMQQIAKLGDMAKGVPPRKTGIERRTPTEEERRLIKAVNEAKIKFQVPITDPATQLRSALDTRKLQLERRTAELQEKLKNQDFTKKPRRELQLDQEAIRLQHNLELVKRKWHEELMKDRLRNRTPLQKVAGGFLEAVNTFRALKASMDLSAVLRQGGFIVFAHPVRGAKTLPSMFKALRSKEGQFSVEQEILKRPNYPLYERSGLNLTEHGQKLSQMEEAYMSRWAEKIPLVSASQRAYTVFLNKLRADSFDAMTKGLSKEGKLTPEEGKIIANYINVATGRGNIGLRENTLVGLNSVFFAPRLVASRFQLLLGQPLYHGLFSGQTKMAGSGAARKAVAKEYARFLAGAGAVYALAELIPGTEPVETDPRSAEFGKIRLGKTRIDPMAGLIQGSVLMSRLATGETKSSKGKIVPIRGDKVPYGGNAADVLARFLRTKLSPAFGTAVDVATGENVVGEPVTTKSVATGLVLPLSFDEIYEAMKEQGVPAGSALAILSIFGMGLQTYDEKQKKVTK